MRLKVLCTSEKKTSIPFNYQYQLHAAIYKLISQSSKEYAGFLHDTGFIDEDKKLKLFTFSKLQFLNRNISKGGFRNIDKFELIFSTPIEKSLEHLVYGIFSGRELHLNFGNSKNCFYVGNIETLSEPQFSEKMKFTCLSPIAITGNSEKYGSKHYLNFTNPQEKEQFVINLYNNLLRKYRVINNKKFFGIEKFNFKFELDYLIKKNGKISKNIKFKNNRIIGMEAPFTLEADPQLIKVGYECGFGVENSAGFGMVKVVED